MLKAINRTFAFLRKPLFWDIGVIPVAALLIVAGILGWVAYAEYEQAKNSEYRLLEAHARNAEVQVATALRRIKRLLSDAAEARLLHKSALEASFAAELERLRSGNPNIGTLLVSDAAGIVRASTNAALNGRDISREPFFTVQRNGPQTPKMFMSRPDKRLLGSSAVSFSLPIHDAQNRFLGIVNASIGFDFFPGLLQDINPEDSASMSVIFNRDGDLLYRRENPEKFFGYNIARVSTVFQEHVSAATAVTHHIGPSFHDGLTRLFVVHNVGDTGLSLILSRQLNEVIAVLRNKLVIYGVIFFFTSVLVGFLAVASARHKREMLAGKAFTEQLIETANVMVVGLNATGCITIFNETAERLTGYPRAEVLGRDWIELAVPPRNMSRMRALYAEFLHAGTLPHSIEYPVINKQGEERIISWQNSVIREPLAAISFGIDVTERNMMDMAFAVAKQKAEESSQAKSKFLAAASHDLRQPIHAQGLFLSALSSTELSAHQSDLVAKAKDASSATNEMLNELLDYSRIEAGVIEPKLQPFRLQSLFNKLEREFELQADAKGLAYRSRETSLVLQSDPKLVEFILRNLLSNAIRYTLQGGLLLACRKRGGQAVLEVWDTGIGIDPLYQQEVFFEFHQLDTPDRDDIKGLGLGLAIAQGLANTLGSKLSLASTPQRGSVFRFSLPITSAALPIEKAIPNSAELRLKNLRVLVIDDDETVRSGMVYQLRDWGFKCVAAESLEEALAMARIQTPDIVVSDYRLRHQRTGLEVITALRELLGEDLPALIITGDTAPDRLREALAGSIPLLHKPVAAASLYQALMAIKPR